MAIRRHAARERGLRRPWQSAARPIGRRAVLQAGLGAGLVARGLVAPALVAPALVAPALVAPALVAPQLAASASPSGAAGTLAGAPLYFGLTPVFLSNDLALLDSLRAYLERATGRSVRLVSRRTYQEITALLVSGQLDAAWICGYPFVQHRDALALLAVPVWQGDCLYRSYLIARPGRRARTVADLAGDIHAFSDPDSNSGHLVTRALLAQRQENPDRFFRRTFFTYGHRNVIRSVASGLAQSGSVDGYVLEVLREVEPAIGEAVEIVHASPWHGFPPVAIRRSSRADPAAAALRSALLEMREDALGRQVLDWLRLDGFAVRGDDLYDTIAANVALVREAAG